VNWTTHDKVLDICHDMLSSGRRYLWDSLQSFKDLNTKHPRTVDCLMQLQFGISSIRKAQNTKSNVRQVALRSSQMRTVSEQSQLLLEGANMSVERFDYRLATSVLFVFILHMCWYLFNH
jgi:hypothetical protein